MYLTINRQIINYEVQYTWVGTVRQTKHSTNGFTPTQNTFLMIYLNLCEYSLPVFFYYQFTIPFLTHLTACPD